MNGINIPQSKKVVCFIIMYVCFMYEYVLLWFVPTRFNILVIGSHSPRGPLPVETRVTGPPILVGGPTMILAPKIWEVYNNSNLVNTP